MGRIDAVADVARMIASACTRENPMIDQLRELQALAQTGLAYSKDPYDLERFTRIRQLAFALIDAHSDSEPMAAERFFLPDKGYATPKVDVRAAVFSPSGILLVKEKRDQRWTLPGGWADVNESPYEAVARETAEETGLQVRVIRLYRIKDRDRHPYRPKYPVSLYKMFFLTEVIGGSLHDAFDMDGVSYFKRDAIPELSRDRILPDDIEEAFVARDEERAGPTHCD
jgi:ADP-ribose pyrophosphatase YjhB (NUDIX family)